MRRRIVLCAAAVVIVLSAIPAGAIQENVLNGASLAMYQTNKSVWAMAAGNGLLYAGGDFTSVRPPGSALGTNEQPRTRLASFNGATGVVTSWNPTVDGRVQAMALSPDKKTLYVGGMFTHVNALLRNHLAAFDTATGNLLDSWKPQTGSTVGAIAVSPDGSRIFVGGSFAKANNVSTFPGGSPLKNLAAFDTSGVLDTNWRARTDTFVGALAVGADLPDPGDQSRVIVGGTFYKLDGVDQHAIGAVSTTDGSLQPWAFNPVPGDSTPPGDACCYSDVKTIITDTQGHAFIGAEGTGGGLFDGTFAANYADGSELWFDDCLGATQGLTLINGWIYVASHMHDCRGQVVGGPTQQPNTWWHITVESPVDGHIGHFFPNTTGNPLGGKAVTTDGTQLFIGGDFKSVNNKAQQGLARFGGPPDTTTPKNLAAPGASSKFCAGTANVSFKTTTDIDDGLLTYSLYRDNVVAPIYTTQRDTRPWESAVISYADTGLVPGSKHTYKVAASDGTNTTPKAWSPQVTVAASTDPYPCNVVTRGASLYWRLGESSGSTAADSSGNNQTGAYQAGTTLAQPGAFGTDTAASFDGNTGLVTSTNAFTDPQAFSLEAWFKTTTTSGGKIIGFGNHQSGFSDNYDRHIYMTDSGQLIFGVWEGFPAIVKSAHAFNDGTWHHVMATIDQTQGMAMYVDGTMVGAHQVENDGSYGWAQGYTGYWRVGGDNLGGWPDGPSSSYFNGTVDEVAIYPSVISPSQVAHDCVVAGGGNYTCLVRADGANPNWRFGESSGTIAHDASASHLDGTYGSGVTLGTSGAISGGDTAAGFDGTASGVVSSNDQFDNPQNFSVEAWFKTTTTSGGKIIGFGDQQSGESSQYDRHIYMTDSGQLIFGVWEGFPAIVQSPGAYNDGVWHHVVATLDDVNGMNLYVDGSIVDAHAVESDGSYGGAQGYAGYWRVGGDNLGGWPDQPSSSYFQGTVDEAAVYVHALASSSVQLHFLAA